jgi:hypothetical protein
MRAALIKAFGEPTEVLELDLRQYHVTLWSLVPLVPGLD